MIEGSHSARRFPLADINMSRFLFTESISGLPIIQDHGNVHHANIGDERKSDKYRQSALSFSG